MELVKVSLVFENFEGVDYHFGKDFRFFDRGKVDEVFSNFCNACTKYKTVDGFTIILTDEADVGRLSGDVTWITLEYSDGTIENFAVMWPDGEEDYHSGQKKTTTELGNVLFVSECSGYLAPVTDEDEIDIWCW